MKEKTMERLILPENYALYLDEKGWWVYTGGGSRGFLREDEGRTFAAAMNAPTEELARVKAQLEVAMEALEDYAAGDDNPARAIFALDDIEALKASE